MTPGADRRRVMIIAAVGVVLIGALGVFALTRGGGGGETASTSTTRASAGAVTTRRPSISSGAGSASTSTTTTTAVAQMPDSFQTFTDRNPFEPAVGAAPSGTTATTSSGTTATTATTGTTATTTGGGTGTGTGTGGAGSQNPSVGTPVQLVEVIAASKQAVVQVGSTDYTVSPGQTFATSYKLVSLSGSCGQFLFGDSPFSLCSGEQVLK